MPLTERLINQRFSYLNGKFIDEGAGDGPSLGDVQMGSMYGSIVQLGYLAQYAHELFDELFKEAKGLDGRIAALASRTHVLIGTLGEAIPHKPEKSSASGTIVVTSKSDIPASAKPTHSLFTRSSQPTSIRKRYDSTSVAPLPAFHKVDELLKTSQAAHSCASQYSYPDFFFNEWKKAEEDRLEKLEDERKLRKQERRARRQQLKEVRESQKNSAINVKQLDWRKKYGGTMEGLAATGARTSGPLTGRSLELKELIQRKERGPLTPTDSATFALPSPGMLPTSPNPVALQSPSPFLSAADLPVPPTISEDQEGTQDDDDTATASGTAPQPGAPAHEPPTDAGSAPSTASLVASTPLNPPPLRSASTAEGEGASRDTIPATTPPEPHKRILSGGLLADIAAGSPLKSASAVGGGGGQGPGLSVDLLSSISQGKALKAAAAEEGSGVATPVSKAKMTMLSEIKMNKTKLKHIDNHDKALATPSSTKAAPAPTLATEVQNILARRKFLQAQSDSDEDSDEEAWKD